MSAVITNRARRWAASASALLLALTGVVCVAIGLARADTANIPVTATASPLTDLVDGSPITVNVDAQSPPNATASQIFGVDARLCAGGAVINNAGDFSPTVGGHCIAQPLSSGSDALVSVAVGPPNLAATLTFRAGVGTNSYTTQFLDNVTITCGPQNPCELVLKMQVPGGTAFKHFDLTYAGLSGTTTTTLPTVTTTPLPAVTTTLPAVTTTTLPRVTTTTLPAVTTTTTAAPTTTTTTTTSASNVQPTAVSPSVVAPGESLTVNSAGWKPGTTVTAVLHSTPLTLGTLTADQSGVVNGSFAIPSGVSTGGHELELAGTDPAGAPRSVTSDLTVSPASSASVAAASLSNVATAPSGQLPLTGARSDRMAGSGVGLIASGALLEIYSRRRRRSATA